MMEWYKNKKEFHYKQWELSQDSNKEKAAAFHMNEYINYSELYDIFNKRKGGQ